MATSASLVPEKSWFSCTTCGKHFERNDHLHRHLDSHRNKRSFKCFHCGKGFNRRDLLTRHYAVHEAATGSNARRTTRASQACRSCATSKLKCDNERPCKRCRLADRPCISSESSIHPEPQSSQTQGLEFPSLEQLYPNGVIQNDSSGDFAQDDQLLSDVQADLSDVYDSFDYPIYFEHIMMPDLLPSDNYRAISQPSLDMGTSPNFDVTFDTISVLDFGTMFDAGKASHFGQQRERNGPTPVQAITTDVPRARLEAFQRSPWLWMPSADQSTFNDQSCFAIDVTSVELATSPQTLSNQDAGMQDSLSYRERDSILLLVKSTSKDRVTVSNFPGPDVLTTLVSTCISKRLRTDAWLHSSTFDSRSARTELLAALVAGGCVCFGIRDVARTGLLLQEVVRMSLDRLFETDNSVVRDLQYLQAYMLWVDMGITCGIKRKMEIAESRFQPLCTALRRAGAFESAMYEHIAPEIDDDEVELERKWKAWAQQESFKRLAYYAQEHDAKVALLFNRQPLISYSEITAPLPSSMDLWLARSAGEWKNVFNTLQDDGDRRLSLRHLLTMPEAKLSLARLIDAYRAGSLLLSGLAGQVWELKQQTLAASVEDSNTSLWLRSRRSELAKRIDTVYTHQTASFPAEQLYQQYLLMSLNVNIDDLHRFAGKNGDDEARDAYRRLEPWSQGKTGRHAIWHAGQIFRAGRCIAPYQFRGFDSIIIYHATLVLWVYGVLRSAEERHKAHVNLTHSRGPQNLPEDLSGTTPSSRNEAGAGVPSTSTLVFLDDREVSTVLVYRELGRGRPGLHLRGALDSHKPGSSPSNENQEETTFCDLRNSNMIMQIGSAVLEQKYPDVSKSTLGSLPPLVENLRDLMRELGQLPGHSEMPV